MKKEFLFSVIIPVYNAEEFIEEAIKSIINQSIGFKKNIQLILVNNATEDNSEEICLKYKNKYPDNIEYIKLNKNRRAAGGRNAGLSYVKGKYFNYLDADDIWPKNVFKKVYKFFEENYNDINIVSCRRRHFGRHESFHAVDYKFTNKNRIIDINKEYKAIQLHVTSCFFKTETCIYKRFNEGIDIGEDHEYINSLILDLGKYAVMNKKIMYFYRKREDGQSALDKKTKSKTYFMNDYEKITSSISEKSMEVYGKIIPFCQYDICYETGYLLKESCSVLNQNELELLINLIKKNAQNIDDEIIMSNHVIKREHKAFFLNLKHGDNYVQNLSLDQLKNLKIFNARKGKNFSLDILELENNILRIGALLSVFPARNRWDIYLKDSNGKKYYPNHWGGHKKTESLEKTIFTRYGVFWDIDLTKTDNLNLMPILEIDNNEYKMSIRCGKWAKASNEVKGSYYYKKENDSSYVIWYTKNKILIRKNVSKIKKELKYLFKILCSFNFKSLLYRILSDFIKPFLKKEIWIVSDRGYSADGNGEFFYKYLINNKKSNNINAYYVINKKTDDYNRIKKYGKCVQFGTFKYKMLYLLADNIVVSMMDDFLNDLPFGDYNKYFLDKDTRKICVGHGVSEQDISRSEGIFSRNFRIYTVSGDREYKSKITDLYGYTSDHIKITGTSRHDGIFEASRNKKGKSIMFAPTWRNEISGIFKNGERMYNPSFKNSEYFKYFNNLINDKRILSIMRENDYTGVFNIHPAHRENIGDFEENELIKVQDRNDSYLQQFSKHRIVITDYSSIAHDYAYADSYVIYSQFDKEKFYKNHVYKEGSFDYEKDGFGPVCYDYEKTVKLIVESIKKQCKMDKKYKERTNNYFKYFDNNNCERIYNEIKKLDKYK